MYGAQAKYGFARQTAEGTPVVATASPGSFHPFPLLNEDVGLEKDEVISQNLTGRFAIGASYDGPANVNGTVEYEITPRNIGAALAMAVTHNPSVITSGSVKGYGFIPNTSDFSATAVKAPWTGYKQFQDSSSAEQFSDLQFGEFSITVAQGQFSKGRIVAAGGVSAVNGVGSASVVPAASDIGRLFPWNVCSVSIGGVGVSVMSEITVALNENIEPLYGLNASLNPIKYTRRDFREITVNGTFYMNDRSTLNDFKAGTRRRLLITLMSTIAPIQSGYYDMLTIDVPQMRILTFKPGASGPGEVAVPFTARGDVDPTSDYSVQYTLQNTYAAGY